MCKLPLLSCPLTITKPAALTCRLTIALVAASASWRPRAWWPLTDRPLGAVAALWTALLWGACERPDGKPSSAHRQSSLSGFLTLCQSKKDVNIVLCFNSIHPKQQPTLQMEGKPSISSYSVSMELMLQKNFKRGSKLIACFQFL